LVFGKIDYINLLPLHIYLKRYPLPQGFKQVMRHKAGVPSKLNQDLYYRRIDGAVISSVESKRKKYKNLDLGICSHKKVLSVLVQKKTKNAADPHSASSNALASLLGQKGKVIIGDEALRLYFKDKTAFVDLCELWHSKTGLPFVFGRFSCTKNKTLYAGIFKNFSKRKIKIPQYILEKYAKTRSLEPGHIKYYLNEIIYYKIGAKERKSLKLFFKALNFNQSL